MYRKEKPMALKGSTSALCNNLSVQVNREKGLINYAVVHKAVVNLVSASTDGTSVNHRQIVCKEPSATVHGATVVLQARLVAMPSRTVLVITSQKGIQMFEADGSLMLFWCALGDPSQVDTCFGRGICGVLGNTICVGTHDGAILVFDIPSKGTNITMAETLREHKAALWDLESDEDRMASGDDLGNIIVWEGGDDFKRLRKIAGAGYPCTSLGLIGDLVIAGYGSGHLRIFDGLSGRIQAEVTAHAKWITSVDVARKSGLVLSASEDSFVRVWQLKEGNSTAIEHKFSESVIDLQLQGAKFITNDGRAFGVTGYDSNEIIFYKN